MFQWYMYNNVNSVYTYLFIKYTKSLEIIIVDLRFMLKFYRNVLDIGKSVYETIVSTTGLLRYEFNFFSQLTVSSFSKWFFLKRKK